MPRHAFLLVLILWLASAALATDPYECQIPRFVVQGTGEGNVMILADNSGSMNEAIYHVDYDPGTTYSGGFSNYSMYHVSSTFDAQPCWYNPDAPCTPLVTLVRSDNGQDGRYIGNYLNWIFWHASVDQLAEIPTVTRIQVLKSVLADVLDMSSRLKFGLTIYQYDHGGSVVARCGANRTSVLATINGITANTWTPTGEALEDIVDYYANDLPSAPIQSPCIKNFCLVVTDGYPTMDLDVSSYLQDADGDGADPGNCASIGAIGYSEANYCSDYMDDVAYYMAHSDLRPDLEGDQIVNTYVVGFHVDAPLLQETADNGLGLYFTARNANELRYSIEWALQDIIRRISAGSAVAVVSTERGYDDRLFRGKFMPVDWHGYLESYQLPYEDGDTPIWEAGSILSDRDPDNRYLFTALGGLEYNFYSGNADALKAAMDIADTDTAAMLIDWGTGEDVEGLRNRHGWVLGDIVHSTPVVVGAPNNFDPSPSYQEFLVAHENREKVVYVGANDGMLHAFRAADGHELWGFVPEFTLPMFEAMADSYYCHHYSVDGTMTIDDCLVDGTWSTVLVGSGREAGNGFFCLDVTDPYTPDVWWQDDTPDGYPYPSQPTIATIGGQPVVLIGSGLEPTDGDAIIYCYDLETGTLEGSRNLSFVNNGRNKATRPATLDLDFDGNDDLAYIGDMDGYLWRIDFNDSSSPAAWSITELFQGNGPITATPTISFDENGNNLIFVGTGSYLDEDDMESADQNYFYCVFDRHDLQSIEHNDLVDQTDGDHDIGNHDGWYVVLEQGAGERITETALVAAGNVLVTSFAPSQDSCIAGGQSWLYRLRYDDGGQPEGTPDDPDPPRVESLGEGIASHPVLDLSAGNVVIQGSDAVLHIEEIGATYDHLVVRSWQESFDYVASPPEGEQ